MSVTRSPSPPAADSHSSASPWPGWLIVCVVSFVLYASTASRGIQWQDSGAHILRIVTAEPVNPRGLALSHPLHHWLGRLAVLPDLLDSCLAITLISALAGAVAVANTYGCVFTLTRTRGAALFAAASLGLAHTFWQQSTLTECNTLVAALLSAECWCIAAFAVSRRRSYLWAALLLNGLGFANHNLALLTAPVLAAVVLLAVRRKEVSPRDVAVGLILWLLGSTPYTGMVISELGRTGEWVATLRSMLFGHHYADEVLKVLPSGGRLLNSLGFVALCFPNLLLPAAGYGIAIGRTVSVPTLVRRYLLAGLVIHAVFALRYPIVDQHTFFLPMYTLLAIFGGIGFAAIGARSGSPPRRLVRLTAIVLLALTPVLYAFTPAIARSLGVLDSVARHKPYRDDYVYLFTPWSVAEDSAERMSRQAVELAGDRGVIIASDRMGEPAIRYRALHDGKIDIEIVNELTPEGIRAAIGAGREVVLVPLNVETGPPNPPLGVWQRVGDLYSLRVDSGDPADP